MFGSLAWVYAQQAGSPPLAFVSVLLLPLRTPRGRITQAPAWLPAGLTALSRNLDEQISSATVALHEKLPSSPSSATTHSYDDQTCTGTGASTSFALPRGTVRDGSLRRGAWRSQQASLLGFAVEEGARIEALPYAETVTETIEALLVGALVQASGPYFIKYFIKYLLYRPCWSVLWCRRAGLTL